MIELHARSRDFRAFALLLGEYNLGIGCILVEVHFMWWRKKNIYLLVFWFIFLVMLFFLATFRDRFSSRDSSVEPHEFRVQVMSFPKYLDPLLSEQTTSQFIVPQFLCPPYRLSPSGELVPHSLSCRWKKKYTHLSCLINKGFSFEGSFKIIRSRNYFFSIAGALRQVENKKSWRDLIAWAGAVLPFRGMRYESQIASIEEKKIIEETSVANESRFDKQQSPIFREVSDSEFELLFTKEEPLVIHNLTNLIFSPRPEPKLYDSVMAWPSCGQWKLKEGGVSEYAWVLIKRNLALLEQEVSTSSAVKMHDTSGVFLGADKSALRDRKTVDHMRFLLIADENIALKEFLKGHIDFLRRLPTSALPQFQKDPRLFQMLLWRVDGFFIERDLFPDVWKEEFLNIMEHINFEGWSEVFYSKGRVGCWGVPFEWLPDATQVDCWNGGSFLSQSPKLFAHKKFVPVHFYFPKAGGTDHLRSADFFRSELERIGLTLILEPMEKTVFDTWLKENKLMWFRKSMIPEVPHCKEVIRYLRDFLHDHGGFQDAYLNNILESVSYWNGDGVSRKTCLQALQKIRTAAKVIPLGHIYYSYLIDPRFQGWWVDPLGRLWVDNELSTHF